MPEQRIITIESYPQALVATLECGELDEDMIRPFLTQMLSVVTGAGTQLVILNLSHLEFIASLGLGAVADLNNQMKKEGRRLMLVGLSSWVRDAFAMTRLDQHITIHPNLDSVWRSIDPG